jgi:hypothetical protein
MRRRPLAWAASLLAVAGAATLLAVAFAPPPRRLNVDAFPLVRTGMTQAEVEGLLGGPPGNYGRHAGGEGMMTLEGYIAPAGSVERLWCDDANRFEIYFDREGRVVGLHKRASYSQSPAPGLFARLRAWLGR